MLLIDSLLWRLLQLLKCRLLLLSSLPWLRLLRLCLGGWLWWWWWVWPIQRQRQLIWGVHGGQGPLHVYV